MGNVMGQNFFAYGSFDEKQVHYPKISQLILAKQEAWTTGEVYRLRCGYPALESLESGALVDGSLLQLSVPETYWTVLDALLGVDQAHSLFSRERILVRTSGGESVEATTYLLNPLKRDQVLRPIANGQWQQDLQSFPPLVRSLEPQHLDYIRKLSSAKGRELVPYKLDVYRTLMSLEIIKDKGRRPALTSLGQEIGLFIQ